MIKHNCKFDSGRCYKQGTQRLTLEIPGFYQDDRDDCCDDHSSLNVEVIFCPICGWQDQLERSQLLYDCSMLDKINRGCHMCTDEEIDKSQCSAINRLIKKYKDDTGTLTRFISKQEVIDEIKKSQE